MTDKNKVLAFEKKLQQLKEEETLILKLLKDVRQQLKKYEVEELQTCNESILNKYAESSDSDESVEGDNEMLLKIIDSAGIVNSTSLDLNTNKIFGNESEEDSEETDDSNEN